MRQTNNLGQIIDTIGHIGQLGASLHVDHFRVIPSNQILNFRV